MKLTSFFTFCFLIILGELYAQVSSQENLFKNHLEIQNLKGKVKAVSEYRYKQSDQQTNTENAKGDLEMFFVWEYNQQGNIITYTHYRGKDNSVARIEKYMYDAKNRLVSMTGIYPENKRTESRDVYRYDTKGRLVGQERFMETTSTVIEKKTYTYDANGRLSVIHTSFPVSNASRTTTFEYKAGSKSSLIVDRSEREETKSYRQYLPSSNIITERAVQYYNGKMRYESYQYDASNNLISMTIYRKDKDKGKEYDGKESCKYQYDQYGNWLVKETTYTNSQTVTKRELIYY